jgi:aspartate carbamoyltransferase regulatory subunit
MDSIDKRKELKVSAIENGTVIDHLPAKSVFQVAKILGLESSGEQILIGTNLESKKFGKKGIIKLANRFFEHDEINKIALVAPSATLIVIRDYQIVEKDKVDIPDHVVRFVRCMNPNCITNYERITTKFTVIDKQEIKLQCHYCEKVTDKSNMIFI